MFALSACKLVEMIGESAAKLSTEERAAWPGVPWRDVIDMRNRLTHGYDTIDYDIVWEVMTIDLPPFLATLREIVGEEGEEPA